jgi:hypothetical protein
VEDNKNMPRRKFLALASAAGLGGTVLLTGDAFAAGGANDLGKVTHPTFAAQIGAAFQLRNAAGKSFTVTLVKVEALPQSTRKNAKRTTFSLLFRGPASPVLGQDVYDIRNDTLGTFPGVFVVWIGLDKAKKNSYYEAIFS